MKMTKIFAALAAAAVSASSFAAMTFSSASAAGEVVAIAGIRGQAGTYTYWGEDDNSGTVTVKDAEIDGNAQYEARWDITGDGTGSIEFLILDLKKPADGENEFTTDTYPDLNVTVDALYIDGEEIALTQSADAYDLAYYESEGKNGSRAYFVANWGVNSGVDLGVSKEQPITSSVKVLFTVSGLYNDGTSNVTEDAPVDEETDAPADEETDAPTDEETDAPADEETDAPAEEETDAPADEESSANDEESSNDESSKDESSEDESSEDESSKKDESSKDESSKKEESNKDSNGGKNEQSAGTGVAGVGMAVAGIALAATAAVVSRKRK